MGKNDQGPISQYNSLTDPYLQGYFSRPPIRDHLKHSGLITRRGEVVPEEVWRKRNAAKDKMQQATHVIASKIVNQALDIKNLDKAETMRKLEAAYKRELVLKIRGQSAQQDGSLPFLWPKYPSTGGGGSRSASASRPHGSASTNHDDIRLVDDDHYHERRRRQQRRRARSNGQRLGGGGKSSKSRIRYGSRSRPNAVDGEKCELLICYLGNTVNIPFDTQVFSPKDKISVYQQHCGGENLLVHSGYYEPGEKFKFVSKRHKEYPFALTFYINDICDCRVSTCCEYRHRPETKIGSHFKVAGIEGAYPCIKCLLEKQSSAGSRSKKDEVKPIRTTTSEPSKRNTIETHEQTVETTSETNSEDDYGGEFDDDGEEWTIQVETSAGHDSFLGGNDPQVFISLHDKDEQTQKIWLSKKHAKTSNKSLFRPGQRDEFPIHTPVKLGALKKIHVGHENKSQGSRWHLNRVVVVNKKTGARYFFDCDRWFAIDEDDHKTSRILNVGDEKKNKKQEDDNKKKKTEIQIKHSESESDDDSSRNRGGQKSGRLSKNDVINNIKGNQSTSRTDNSESRASSARSLGGQQQQQQTSSNNRKDVRGVEEKQQVQRSVSDVFKNLMNPRKSSTDSSENLNQLLANKKEQQKKSPAAATTTTTKSTKSSTTVTSRKSSRSSDEENESTLSPQSSKSSDKKSAKESNKNKKQSKAMTTNSTSNSSSKVKSSLESDFDSEDLSSLLDFKKKDINITNKAATNSVSEKNVLSSSSSSSRRSSESSKKNDQEANRDTNTSAELRRLKDTSVSSSQSSVRPSVSDYPESQQQQQQEPATTTTVTKMIIPTVNIIPSSDPENRTTSTASFMSRPSTQSRASTTTTNKQK